MYQERNQQGRIPVSRWNMHLLNSIVIHIVWWFLLISLHGLQALLYMVKVMDTVVDSPYVVVYFHTLTNGANHPPMNYMKQAYSMLDHR